MRTLDEAELDAFEQAMDLRPRVEGEHGSTISAVRASLAARGLLLFEPTFGYLRGMTRPTPLGRLLYLALKEQP